MPEKSGMGAVVVCAQAGVTTAAVNTKNEK
jgi:hypothetical protein